MSIFYWDESKITDAVFGKAIAPTSLENSGPMTTIPTAELEALRALVSELRPSALSQRSICQWVGYADGVKKADDLLLRIDSI